MTIETLSRRQTIASFLSAALLPAAFAQPAWPNRPLKFIVPGSAGTGLDVIARLVADQLGRQLGQAIVVENVNGAAGIVGTEKAVRAPADGYTFLFGYNQLVAINPYLYNKLPYDPVRGLVPISLIAKGGYALIASPTMPFNTFEGFVDYARTHPGKLAYASSGNGSVAHLGMELIKQKTGTDLLHVPYRSGSDIINDLMSGQVQVRLELLNTTVPLARSGRVKVLAVSTLNRNRAMPDVPTLKEKLTDFGEITGWNAIWAQPGVPSPIIERMAKEIALTMVDPKVVQKLVEMGVEAQSSTPAGLANLAEKDALLWGNLIKENGIKAD